MSFDMETLCLLVHSFCEEFDFNTLVKYLEKAVNTFK